ncbi:similar to Saccharomyces cerevisiae YDR256C CTA1 Catalase A, breaks down hydrogen peroxide in the peroxisomal matrix formed by acyl-CoA oxidase (Pox1p) during fatty acid beta-oxidation [Maudiozyma barnettii]|uniref:Catalase n=1 Tax=Maudiozyma barnettii TaxID=61262 RepID=A0A8H2VGK9_9SACH|nr:catalase A [Kazachstania barnettii]CAB4255055.1 similar to Saccharomyces cerevisiae YDR256C CTA1 Catalase A, breaks down hydrogen peroxide in the peroxisomal matrix formed by acyl-CoA oxidase (Pox1p) during fatty acid beta-oxidation [Kazachstania barnettii]CAD1783326.1 similar to Saccharomyces cerevisiae YDR256C CTA1 Catalase A, breaks down hydrogen peroxide in the peroxisomal matrix formed by acyl-CoA oxidase (Pox1p) during fatty acid beta-oxidation [Kazachstania barnettii]
MKLPSNKLNIFNKRYSSTIKNSIKNIKKRPTNNLSAKMSCPMKNFDVNGVRKDRIVTTSNGYQLNSSFATQRVGEHGPLLLQDNALLDNLAHFNRERIPERNPHAHGSGAFGYFEVTHDISDICGSAMFDTIGKKTKCVTRFSTVGGEKGSADTVRDPRGFATKFYTEEGNLDWVYNATPVFFLRDPSKFPAFIHTQKRNPQTNLKDADMFWDYLTTPANQVAIHQLCILFSDRGIPQSYRHMHGYSGHAYKWSNKKGEWHYVQVHIKSDQGIKCYTSEEAAAIAGRDPDICHRDLFENIENGNAPSWTVSIQTMTEEESKKLPFSVFDLTKVWPQSQFPLRPVGKLVLNENPQNFFAQIEQAAFAPSNTVPYQEASADPVLQGRLFAYADAQRHRIGPNYNQVPVNCPMAKGFFNPLIRDGAMNVNGNFGSESNYYNTNSKYEFLEQSRPIQEHQEIWKGPAIPYEWVTSAGDVDFIQATNLYRKVLSKQDGAQGRLAHNVATHAANCKSTDMQKRVVDMFTRVDQQLGNDIKTEISSINSSNGKPKL